MRKRTSMYERVNPYGNQKRLRAVRATKPVNRSDRYAMVINDINVTSSGNNSKVINLVAGEVVKVITVRGSVTVVRPYNQRSMVIMPTSMLNFSITQDKRNFYTSFGVRRIVGM